MAQFNFKPVFERIGQEFARGLQKRIPAQVGIDGQAYSKPAESTLKGRRGKVGKTGKILKSSLSNKRLWKTGEFSKEAFGYKASEVGVKVFAREVSHTGGISNAQILRYNSKGQPQVNKNIANPPLVFPSKPDEVLLMHDELRLAKELFARDAKKQMREMAAMNLKVQLNLG